MSSRGKCRTSTRPCTRCSSSGWVPCRSPGHILPLLSGAVLMPTCPLLTLLQWDCVSCLVSTRFSSIFLCYSSCSVGVRPDRPPFVHQWALGFHDPLTGSPVVLPWVASGRTTAYWEHHKSCCFRTFSQLSNFHNLIVIRWLDVTETCRSFSPCSHG